MICENNGVSGQKPRIVQEPARQVQIGDNPRRSKSRSSLCLHGHGTKFNRTAVRLVLCKYTRRVIRKKSAFGFMSVENTG